MLYFVFFSENGLKSSVARPSLRFLTSFAKILCQNLAMPHHQLGGSFPSHSAGALCCAIVLILMLL
jgi:hypothetical protein